ncbi:MAG: hypothetical protein ACK5QT_00150 [Oligoflexia bacterium]|jgi:hypothetical protein
MLVFLRLRAAEVVAWMVIIGTAAFGFAFARAEALPSPVPSRSAAAMTEVEKSSLRSAFLRALEAEVKALRQRHRAEGANLMASQRARLRELQTTRRDYLKSDQFKQASRRQRREAGQDFNARFKALNELLAAERKGQRSDQKASVKSLELDQKRRLQEFDASLSVGQRPSDLLWTGPGR